MLAESPHAGSEATGSPAPYRLQWDAASQADWHGLIAACERSSLEQTWAYGTAVAATRRAAVRRGVVRRGDEPVAIVQVFEKAWHLPLLWAQLLRGPLLLPACDPGKDLADVVSSIEGSYRRRDRRFLFWTPELPVDPGNEHILGDCGLRRMATGYSTVWIDLSQSADQLRRRLHGKWRNMLAVAERGPLRCEVHHGGRLLHWLTRNYEAYRKVKGFVGPNAALAEAIVENSLRKEDVLLLTALHGRDPQAAILVLRHGQCATYFLSYTSPEGRRQRAHNLLLWRALLVLQELGVRWFDLGGVNPAAPGIARFKLGMGGRLETLAGTYL